MAQKRSRARTGSKAGSRRWSARVMARSDALDLQKDIFKSGSASRIAASLKRSALRSRRRKSAPFRSAMSMLNFYINRASRSLDARRRAVLEHAKDELRRQFHRERPVRPHH